MFTGLTANSAKHLVLDAGAFLKNYEIASDTWESAKGTKLIGATTGGGTFSAVPTVRNIEFDGAVGPVKGLEAIDGWLVKLTANVKEITVDSLKLSLGAADSSKPGSPDGYTKIVGRDTFKDEDYLDNLTWVGRLAGSEKPVIIVVKNALTLSGLSLTMKDKNEGLIPVTVTGHYTADDLETPPFDIYYPDVT